MSVCRVEAVSKHLHALNGETVAINADPLMDVRRATIESENCFETLTQLPDGDINT